MTSQEFVMTFGAGVGDVLRNAHSMIADARQWASTSDWVNDVGFDPDTQDWAIEYARMQERVADMEKSWNRCLVQLVVYASQSGRLDVLKDSEASLFWSAKDGLHGGLIWHASYGKGETRLPVGTWSLHT